MRNNGIRVPYQNKRKNTALLSSSAVCLSVIFLIYLACRQSDNRRYHIDGTLHPLKVINSCLL